MPDGRHSYFTQTIQTLTGFECSTVTEDNTAVISQFLDDPAAMVMRAVLTEKRDLQLSLLTDASAAEVEGRVAEVCGDRARVWYRS